MFDLITAWLDALLGGADPAVDLASEALLAPGDGLAPVSDLTDVGDHVAQQASEIQFGQAITVGSTAEGEEVIWSTAENAGGETVVASTGEPAAPVSARTGT